MKVDFDDKRSWSVKHAEFMVKYDAAVAEYRARLQKKA